MGEREPHIVELADDGGVDVLAIGPVQLRTELGRTCDEVDGVARTRRALLGVVQQCGARTGA